MTAVVFDNTWAGLLSAIFDVYDAKLREPLLTSILHAEETLFGERHDVITVAPKAKRVSQKLKQLLGGEGLMMLIRAFLSEDKNAPQHIYEVAKDAFATQQNVLPNLSSAHALFVQQTNKKVRREKHRMEAFVRFQKAKDGLFFAFVEPDFNVLPLIAPHFKNRYADQQWLIYDTQRKYGIHYNLQMVSEVELHFHHHRKSDVQALVYDEQEVLYQQLWKTYFATASIAARENPKLHIQHMPRRYWKHLIEKQ